MVTNNNIYRKENQLYQQRVVLFVITLSTPLPDGYSITKIKKFPPNRNLFPLSCHYLGRIRRKT